MLSDATLRYGEEMATALLGVDALYQAETTESQDPMRERLVVLNMSTTHQPDCYTSYADARAQFTALQSRAATLPEADRRRYYDQVCHSTLAFIAWREGNLPFTGQIADFLHVPAAPASDAELDALRGEMRGLLTDMGYAGDLTAQAAAWEERNRVASGDVAAVLDALLDEAWDRTVQRMEIPAPKSDGMRVVTETAVPYNARCDYLQRTVHLNSDPIFTRPGLKHLAVH